MSSVPSVPAKESEIATKELATVHREMTNTMRLNGVIQGVTSQIQSKQKDQEILMKRAQLFVSLNRIAEADQIFAQDKVIRQQIQDLEKQQSLRVLTKNFPTLHQIYLH